MGGQVSSEKSEKKAQKLQKSCKYTIFQCETCNKSFKTRSGAWKHKQTCGKDDEPMEYDMMYDDESRGEKDAIMMLIKQNQEFKELVVSQNTQIIELSRQATTTNNTQNITTNNIQHQTFNLNLFLNETCKDAMNITEFVNSLKLNLMDLEKVGELGYAEGISRMFVNGLNELDITKRPIHCSDLKREIIHIKDQDKWERDTENQDKLKKAIRDLSNKNIMLLDDWRDQNPGCDEYNHNKNDMYLRMMVETMGPCNNGHAEKRDFNKIIRAVAKNTIIQKTSME